MYPFQAHYVYPFLNSFQIKNRVFIKIWCRKDIFIFLGDIKTLIALFSFILKYLHVLHTVVLGNLINFSASGKPPTLQINPCHHYALECWIMVSMTALNMGIHIGSKHFVYCTSTGRICIKINEHWSKMSSQCIIFLG